MTKEKFIQEFTQLLKNRVQEISIEDCTKKANRIYDALNRERVIYTWYEFSININDYLEDKVMISVYDFMYVIKQLYPNFQVVDDRRYGKIVVI